MTPPLSSGMRYVCAMPIRARRAARRSGCAGCGYGPPLPALRLPHNCVLARSTPATHSTVIEQFAADALVVEHLIRSEEAEVKTGCGEFGERCDMPQCAPGITFAGDPVSRRRCGCRPRAAERLGITGGKFVSYTVLIWAMSPGVGAVRWWKVIVMDGGSRSGRTPTAGQGSRYAGFPGGARRARP